MNPDLNSRKVKDTVITILVIAIATVSFLPFVLMFFMSTQNNNMIFAGRFFEIGPYLKDNFKTIIEADFFRAFLNSIIVAVSSTCLTVFFSAMAGFGFAKYEFRHKDFWFKLVLVTMMIPMEVGMVAFVWEMKVMHLSNTLLPLILPNIANAFGVFWMTQFIRDAFPYELMESGRLDGCSDMGVFLRIAFPIIKPAIFTLSIISFLNSWNSYLLPMIMINDPKQYTVPLVIATMGNMFVADYGARILGVVVGVSPILILFVFFSKQITEGLTTGAVKG